MAAQEILGYRFDAFVVDLRSRRLLKDGDLVATSAKVFDIIVLLVASAGTIVTRQHLVQAIWGGESVREDNIDQHIRLARVALDDRTKPYRYIRTIQSRGYAFGAPVKVVSGVADGAVEQIAEGAAFAAVQLMHAAVELERIGTPAAYDAGAECLERAYQLDPMSVAIAARAAWSQVRRAVCSFDNAQPLLMNARRSLARTAQRDDGHPDVIATRAALSLYLDRDADAAIESLLRAPQAGLRSEKLAALLVQAYTAREMQPDARVTARKAMADYPGSALVQYFSAFAYYYGGDIELAAAQLRQLVAQRPSCGAAHLLLSFVYVCQDNVHAARQRLSALLMARAPLIGAYERLRAPAIALLAYIAARDGDRSEARALVQDLRTSESTSYCAEALAAIGLGDSSTVATWLARAYERQEPWSLFFALDPLYGRWRRSEREESHTQKLRIAR